MFTIKMETARFNSSMNTMLKKVKGPQKKKAMKAIAVKLLGMIVANTGSYRHPVDTGRARAGWYAAASRLGMPWQESGTDLAAVAEGKAAGGYKEYWGSPVSYIDLINGVRYIIFLEYGRSDQAPYGMVRYNMRKMMNSKQASEEWFKSIKVEWNKHF